MTQFSVIKNGLVPQDDDARAMLGKLKIGAVVYVDVLNPINSKFNGKIFATIKKLADATGVTTKNMKAALLLQTGRYEMVVLADGRRVPVPDSMSRSAMTMAEREQFWADLQEVAREKILPTLQPTDRDEIQAMFDQEGTTHD